MSDTDIIEHMGRKPENKPEGLFPPNRIAEWRERRGLSMGALAAKMPFHAQASQINKIEKRRQNLDTKWLLGLTEALDLDSPSDLLVLSKKIELSEKAKKIGRAFDGFSDSDQQVVWRMVDSLAQRPSSEPSEPPPLAGQPIKKEG